MAHDWGGCPSLARSDSWVGVGAGEGAIQAAFSEATWESTDVRACRNPAGKTGRFPLGLIENLPPRCMQARGLRSSEPVDTQS